MSEQVELWSKYRETWETFSRLLARMQELEEAGLLNDAAAALVEVRKARAQYNAARDLLAKDLALRLEASRTHRRPEPLSVERERQIRRTARLLWEFAGKPRNTAEADWHHAEQLVRGACG